MRLCNQTIDGAPCVYRTISPKVPSCLYHRLLKTTIPGQARAAELRLAAAPQPHRDRVPAYEWPAGERWCAGCQSFVPLFYATGSKCKACARADAGRRRRQVVFALADEQWQEILALQDGKCAICRNQQRDRAPAVEHNHSTGVVRGAACVRCNHDLLGAATDSPRRLAAALIYLLAPPTSGRWVKPEISVDPVLTAVADVLSALQSASESDR